MVGDGSDQLTFFVEKVLFDGKQVGVIDIKQDLGLRDHGGLFRNQFNTPRGLFATLALRDKT